MYCQTFYCDAKVFLAGVPDNVWAFFAISVLVLFALKVLVDIKDRYDAKQYVKEMEAQFEAETKKRAEEKTT